MKFTRNLDGVSLDQHQLRLRHKHHTKVGVIAADKTKDSYYVRQVDGRFNKLPIDLRVLISKRRLGHNALRTLPRRD